MKKNLTLLEIFAVASLLFGMMFGAGNLIFPIHMGQLAGNNMGSAVFGFIVTGVGLPLLGVIALAITHKNDMRELGEFVNKPYSIFLTIALYLTIGPFFAIPRCASTSFTVGFEPLINQLAMNHSDNEFIAGLTSINIKVYLLLFTLIFFLIVLYFSLKPSGILTWIGKFINPIFLIFFSILLVVAILRPSISLSEVIPDDSLYTTQPFFKGVLEGYNTMDAIASLAFGITIIEVVRSLGVTEDSNVTRNIIKSALITALLMAILYIATTLVGAQSRGFTATSANGGIAFAEISEYYFGQIGIVLLLLIVTTACLKTSIGLVTSCSEMFHKLFPKFLSEKAWAIIFTAFSFIVSNFGLSAIIEYSIPVLMFLYPLTISLILLCIFGKLFNYNSYIFKFVTFFNLIMAFLDFINYLPENAKNLLHINPLVDFANAHFPLYTLGLGWLIPSIIGLILGLLYVHFFVDDEHTATY